MGVFWAENAGVVWQLWQFPTKFSISLTDFRFIILEMFSEGVVFVDFVGQFADPTRLTLLLLFQNFCIHFIPIILNLIFLFRIALILIEKAGFARLVPF